MIFAIVLVILGCLSVLEIGMVCYKMWKQKNKQFMSNNLEETAKMIKKILLTNKWENIDDMINILKKDSIHINYKLRYKK